MKPALLMRLVLAALFWGMAGPAWAAAVQVTYLEGGVFQGPSQQGPWRPLGLSETLGSQDFVQTGADGIVELTLADASVVRLAPGSLYAIQEAVFSPEQPRRYVAKLFVGKLWANIQKRSGRLIGRFDTRIPTAVVGVRGTVYNLIAARDRSADIQVYEGLVGVGPPLLVEGAAREEIQWPSQVSERQWEEIILAKLQRLRIDAEGRPGSVEALDAEAVRDRWVVFNQQRDARRP
jgi:hypothetical protein